MGFIHILRNLAYCNSEVGMEVSYGYWDVRGVYIGLPPITQFYISIMPSD